MYTYIYTSICTHRSFSVYICIKIHIFIYIYIYMYIIYIYTYMNTDLGVSVAPPRRQQIQTPRCCPSSPLEGDRPPHC